MNIKQQIKELRNKLDELEKQVNGKETSGRYIPAYDTNYYYIGNDGEIYSGLYNSTTIENYRISVGNCFKTKEEAEKHRRILINTQKLKDLAKRLNGDEMIDWSTNNSQTKYCLCFYASDTLEQYKHWDSRMQGAVYCLDENFLEKAIAEIGKEELIELIKGKP